MLYTERNADTAYKSTCVDVRDGIHTWRGMRFNWAHEWETYKVPQRVGKGSIIELARVSVIKSDGRRCSVMACSVE